MPPLRFNAPLTFTTQNRAVTSEDYAAIIKKEFSNIDVARSTSEELAKDLNMLVPQCQKARLLLRNCVKPELALHIFKCASIDEQKRLTQL